VIMVLKILVLRLRDNGSENTGEKGIAFMLLKSLKRKVMNLICYLGYKFLASHYVISCLKQQTFYCHFLLL
jgi:hypothetical protein